MARWKFVNKFVFTVTVLLLLASCSVPPADRGDIITESVECDVVVDAFDPNEVVDIIDEVDIPVDSFEDSADADDVHFSDIDDDGDIPEDASSDAFICGDVPKEGCPCDKSTDEPCCIMIAQGLTCSLVREVDGVWITEWGILWDCGCDDGPQCEGYEIYPLCPWESRKEYF
ncbi:MAG TPA: hypothetical protein PKG82_06035 [Myxococcota bacterium]|nr:hypothetical protein [Myxococcota bacterium]